MIICFNDVLDVDPLKEEERAMITKVQILIEVLMINPSTSTTPEGSFSLAPILKTGQRPLLEIHACLMQQRNWEARDPNYTARLVWGYITLTNN